MEIREGLWARLSPWQHLTIHGSISIVTIICRVVGHGPNDGGWLTIHADVVQNASNLRNALSNNGQTRESNSWVAVREDVEVTLIGFCEHVSTGTFITLGLKLPHTETQYWKVFTSKVGYALHRSWGTDSSE